ncbi:signal peptide peptidase-domain-containing protein [Boeremia exigua]|uniref:signal peptide peptidase-domain-containing protein n=1 Tax=Boeremia exigua TaxID=749465 RepID=UPI001E8D9A0A|nr:signal peptide peptidase-domain-containing protein [Boeremia exigua]KAH6618493.1 signal peptide peptidase-domain-containing protein [Boeremia exigua]
MADAEPTLVAQIFERLAYEFAEARPMLPTYLHLIASALFPIYTGAHASLSRPSTAAKPSKKKDRKALLRKGSDTDDDAESSDDDEEEEEQHNMEGLSPKDALLMPLFAGIALSGLYFLLKWMNDPKLLNRILNAYFAIFGVFSVSKLVTDVLDIGHSIIFPRRHVINGTLYHINSKEEKAVPVAGDTKGKKVLSTPLPGFLARTPLNDSLRKVVWNDRAMPANKWSLKLYLYRALAAKFKVGAHDIVGALTGLCVVAYFNFVDKPWYLTNLLGFGFSYGALQLMSPTTFATGSLILGALFFYDIYFVFYTPMMVTVAKSLDVPIKLMFPRPGDPNHPNSAPSHAMLGLGDVVLPGIVIGLALRFDLYLFYLRRQRHTSATLAAESEITQKAEYFPLAGRWSDHFWTHSLIGQPLWVKDDKRPEAPFTFPKTYFKAGLAGYVLGLLATLGVMMIWDHAQPALLYLVPGVLGSLWLTAVARGELSLMWNYTEAIDEEEKSGESGKDDTTTNNISTEEKKRVTRSESKAAMTASGDSEGDIEVTHRRRSRRSRPEREVFSFVIEAPSTVEKSKANKKHARPSTAGGATTEAKGTKFGQSTAVNVSAEPAGKRQKLR